jgi:hypothetical protein
MLPLDQSINMYVVAVVEDDPTANQQSVLVFSHSQSKDISVNIPEPVNTKSTPGDPVFIYLDSTSLTKIIKKTSQSQETHENITHQISQLPFEELYKFIIIIEKKLQHCIKSIYIS